MPQALVVYIDGACPNNGQHGAKGGIGIYCNDARYPIARSEAMTASPTNNRVELYAALRALQLIPDNWCIALQTDSKNVVDTFNYWIHTWSQNGWRTANGHSVQNQELIRQILGLINNRRYGVSIEHVSGHSGDHGNEQADRLAREGCAK
ncbi:unnamed protein product [Parajaminaea phylloscopi]